MSQDDQLRIPNPHVLQDDLTETTGAPEVDALLFSLVNILQIAMQRSLRCIMVIGSYAHGGYASDSDIDLCFVWKSDSTPEDWRRGSSLCEHFARGRGYVLDPMWTLPEVPLYDAEAFSYAFSVGSQNVEIPCGPLLKLAMKEHSILLWGEDIRPRIRLPEAREVIQQDVLAAPVNWIRAAHYDSHDALIESPLADPAPEVPDRGYGDLKRVAIFVTHMARALVFLETGEFLFDKRQVADAFDQHCGAPWAAMVRGIHDARQGGLPGGEAEEAYHLACQSLTGFQNHFLRVLATRGVDPSTISG